MYHSGVVHFIWNLGLGRVFGFFLFHCVPIDSQSVPQVSNVFTKKLPIALHFLSHVVGPWFNFHMYERNFLLSQ